MNKIRIYMRLLPIAFLVIVLAGFASCSDDNGGNGEEEQRKEEIAHKAAMDTLFYETVVNNIVSGQLQADGSYKTVPNFGQVLHSELPDVYYIVADDEQAAAKYFTENMVPQDAVDSIRHNADGSMTLPTVCGALTYRPSVDGHVAVVDVSLEDVVGYVRQFVFLTKSEWPYNGEDSPFQLCQVLRCLNNDRYYVCAKEWDGGGSGRLVTLDGGWDYDSYKDWSTENMGFGDKKLVVYKNCSDKVALKYLGYMCQYRHEELEGVVKQLTTAVGAYAVEKNPTLAFLKNMSGSGNYSKELQIGTPSVSWEWRFFKWNHYDLAIPYYYISKNSYYASTFYVDCDKYKIDMMSRVINRMYYNNIARSSALFFNNRYSIVEDASDGGVIYVINGIKFKLIAQ